MNSVRIYTYLVKQDANLTDAPLPQYDLNNLIRDAEKKFVEELDSIDHPVFRVEAFGQQAALVETLLPPERFHGEVAYLLSLLCEEKGTKDMDTENALADENSYDEMEGFCVIENGDNLRDRFAEINAFNKFEEAKGFFNRRVGMFGGGSEQVKEAIEDPECKYFFTAGYRIMIERIKYHNKIGG